MRILTVAAFAASGAALLGACSTTPMDNPTYAEEYRQLSVACSEQGGVLVPNGAANTGDPATDYACSRRDRLLN